MKWKRTVCKIHEPDVDEYVYYEDYRTQIRTGDVLAFFSSTGTNLFDGIYAKIITYVTKERIHHVGMAYVSGGRVFIVEAMPPFVRMIPLSRRGSFYHLPMGVKDGPQVEVEVLSAIGKRYSIKDAITAWSAEKVEDENGVQCAEHVVRTLTKLGIKVEKEYIPGKLVTSLTTGDVKRKLRFVIGGK